jgi:xylan 1,4-beta-xylosidase
MTRDADAEPGGTKPALFINPLDVAYAVQDQSFGPFRRRVNREAADPSVVLFRDRFYLFASMSGGFWHSEDLARWEFMRAPQLPVYDYAPDVRVIDDRLVMCASRRNSPSPFYCTEDPLGGQWAEVAGTRSFWDPHLFQDDDGRVYLYQGCSSRTPIDVVELDRSTFRPLGEPIPVIASDVETRGWERRGESYDPTTIRDHPLLKWRLGTGPYIEGPWMTKHDGRYYLQYSAPGTRLNTYADGYYVGTSPLGPFEYASASPFSLKPGGFITGAGHGSTFQDRHGNWWHAASMRISVNDIFERRLGIFPAGFDEDGTLFSCQEFADYPIALPDGPADPRSLVGGSMLLSAAAPVTASSSLIGHEPGLIANEDVREWWVAESSQPDEWVEMTLPEGCLVESIQVNLAEHRWEQSKPRPRRKDSVIRLWQRRSLHAEPLPTPFVVEGTVDGENWIVVADARDEDSSRSHAFFALAQPQPFRALRLTGGAQPYGSHFAVSGLRVFGRGSGSLPDPVVPRVERLGPLDVRVVWDHSGDAHGHNVRWGRAPDKLSSCWQVREATSLDVGALNADVEYWMAVDAFNTNGVTRGKPVPVAPWVGR